MNMAKNNNNNKSQGNTFYQLKVYKAAVDLERQLNLSTQKTKRSLKYGIVDRSHEEIINLITKISFAHVYINDRAEFIKESIDLVNKIKIYIRVLYDVNGIVSNGFAALELCVENVSKQLEGWYNSVVNPTNNSQQVAIGGTTNNTTATSANAAVTPTITSNNQTVIPDQSGAVILPTTDKGDGSK